MLKYLLDSVILIDHLNGVTAASKYLSKLKTQEIAISVITRAEILTGIEKENKVMVKTLLDQYYLFIIDKKTTDKAAELRQEYNWKLPDAFQAALAIDNNIKLVTRNTKDFKKSLHPFVETPYRLS